MDLTTTARDLGVLWAYALSAFLFVVWMFAYLSPQKAVILSINRYGEAHVELVAWFIVLPVMLISARVYLADVLGQS